MARSPKQLANLKRGDPAKPFTNRNATEMQKRAVAARKKNKTLREIFRAWAESETSAEDFKKLKENAGVDDDTNLGVLVAATIRHGVMGNSKYMDMMMRYVGENLTQDTVEESGFLEALGSKAAEDWNEEDIQV